MENVDSQAGISLFTGLEKSAAIVVYITFQLLSIATVISNFMHISKNEKEL